MLQDVACTSQALKCIEAGQILYETVLPTYCCLSVSNPTAMCFCRPSLPLPLRTTCIKGKYATQYKTCDHVTPFHHLAPEANHGLHIVHKWLVMIRMLVLTYTSTRLLLYGGQLTAPNTFHNRLCAPHPSDRAPGCERRIPETSTPQQCKRQPLPHRVASMKGLAV